MMPCSNDKAENTLRCSRQLSNSNTRAIHYALQRLRSILVRFAYNQGNHILVKKERKIVAEIAAQILIEMRSILHFVSRNHVKISPKVRTNFA